MTAAYRLIRGPAGASVASSLREQHFGLEVADRVVTDLEKAFELLATNPDVGHHREDLTRDERVLFWSVAPTLIAYRSSPEWVEILFVERGDLDWERMLTEYLK